MPGNLISKLFERQRSRTIKQEMPGEIELQERFNTFITSIDLPPDKAELLKNNDCETKWDIICAQELVQIQHSPTYYLNILRMYLDPDSSRCYKKRHNDGENIKQVFIDLEISLRTNPIEWMNNFLDKKNLGLDVLIDYLNLQLGKMLYEQNINELSSDSEEKLSYTDDMTNSTTNRTHFKYIRSAWNAACVPIIKRFTQHITKVNMEESKEDIHAFLMCMRAIIKNKCGFNMVIQHREAINCITMCLIHRNLHTKALVLELLTAICSTKVGHDKIISAFDNLMELLNERCRFETLMEYFINQEPFHLEFMVSWIQFVNKIVHSINDMDFRVYLQSEFTALHLNDYLERLRSIESEVLQLHISIYLSNVFLLDTLVEENNTKLAVNEKVAKLEDKLRQANDRLHIFEPDTFTKICNDFTKRHLNIVYLQPLFDEIRDEPNTYENMDMEKIQKQLEEACSKLAIMGISGQSEKLPASPSAIHSITPLLPNMSPPPPIKPKMGVHVTAVFHNKHTWSPTASKFGSKSSTDS